MKDANIPNDPLIQLITRKTHFLSGFIPFPQKRRHSLAPSGHRYSIARFSYLSGPVNGLVDWVKACPWKPSSEFPHTALYRHLLYLALSSFRMSFRFSGRRKFAHSSSHHTHTHRAPFHVYGGRKFVYFDSHFAEPNVLCK